jgi:cobalt/nickel transport system permease protein
MLAWLGVSFASSGITHLPTLLLLWLIAMILFYRQARMAARKTVVSAVPITLCLILASAFWVRFLQNRPPPWHAYAALALRSTLITFLGFAVLARVNLLEALRPFPTVTRLLVITLAQIQALRRLVVESRLGLASRLPRKANVADMVQSGGAITAAVFHLSIRNAEDIADALRSRGF